MLPVPLFFLSRSLAGELKLAASPFTRCHHVPTIKLFVFRMFFKHRSSFVFVECFSEQKKRGEKKKAGKLSSRIVTENGFFETIPPLNCPSNPVLSGRQLFSLLPVVSKGLAGLPTSLPDKTVKNTLMDSSEYRVL